MVISGVSSSPGTNSMHLPFAYKKRWRDVSVLRTSCTMNLIAVYFGCSLTFVACAAWQSAGAGGWKGVPASSSQVSNSPKPGWAPTVELKSDGWKIVSSGSPSASGWKSSSQSTPRGGGWQSRSAPIQDPSTGGSGGYSVTWVAPSSPALPAPLTYGGQDPAWRMVPVGGGVWLPMAAVMRSGLGPQLSRNGRWVQEDGHLVWETKELQTPAAASLTAKSLLRQWQPEEDQKNSAFEFDPLRGHAVSWSWSRKGRDLLN